MCTYQYALRPASKISSLMLDRLEKLHEEDEPDGNIPRGPYEPPVLIVLMISSPNIRWPKTPFSSASIKSIFPKSCCNAAKLLSSHPSAAKASQVPSNAIRATP